MTEFVFAFEFDWSSNSLAAKESLLFGDEDIYSFQDSNIDNPKTPVMPDITSPFNPKIKMIYQAMVLTHLLIWDITQ